MLARLIKGLSFANVVATLALFFALSTGAVYAANEWTGANIVDESLNYLDIAPESLGTGRIKDESLLAADLAPDSVTMSEIATDAVGAFEIADNSIDGGEIIDESVGAAELGSASVQSSEIAANAVGASEIAFGAVGASEIAAGAVTTARLLDGSVNSVKVANDSLTTADLLGTDVTGQITINAGIASGRCANFTITAGGASQGEVVLFSVQTPAVPTGIIFHGLRVPLDDTVLVAVCNHTAGPSPAMANLPIRIITFD